MMMSEELAEDLIIQVDLLQKPAHLCCPYQGCLLFDELSIRLNFWQKSLRNGEKSEQKTTRF
jgi:hypothetical protein